MSRNVRTGFVSGQGFVRSESEPLSGCHAAAAAPSTELPDNCLRWQTNLPEASKHTSGCIHMSTCVKDIDIEHANADITGKVAATRQQQLPDATRVPITRDPPNMLSLPPFCFPGFDLAHHRGCDRGCFPGFDLAHHRGCDRGWLACCGSRTLQVSQGNPQDLSPEF